MFTPRLIVVLAALATSHSFASPPPELLETWRAQALAHVDGFTGFSADRGKALYTSKVTDWSCSTCHTSDPRNTGRHAITNKTIQPLSPLVNAKRFSDPAKVEKWFRRNCNDVLKRECTAIEKGDVLTYLLAQQSGEQK